MKNDWIKIAHWANEWASTTVYISPSTKTAKVHTYEISHWGYHDESERDESERIITAEQAIALVYPDEAAISLIKQHTGRNYPDLLAKLAGKGNI